MRCHRFSNHASKSYLELSGRTKGDLRQVATLYLPDETGIGPARLPCSDGPHVVCQCCGHTFPHPEPKSAVSAVWADETEGSDCESMSRVSDDWSDRSNGDYASPTGALFTSWHRFHDGAATPCAPYPVERLHDCGAEAVPAPHSPAHACAAY